MELKYLTNNFTTHYTTYLCHGESHRASICKQPDLRPRYIHYIAMFIKINKQGPLGDLHLRVLLFTSFQLLCTLHTKILNQDSGPKITVSITQLHCRIAAQRACSVLHQQSGSSISIKVTPRFCKVFLEASKAAARLLTGSGSRRPDCMGVKRRCDPADILVERGRQGSVMFGCVVCSSDR